MKTIKLLLLLVAILWQLKIFGQNKSPDFGQFTTEEIQMKTCPFDPEAEAVKLLDEGISVYDLYSKLFTTRRLRIKILKSTGIGRADISIPFYTKENYETVEILEAITYNFDERGNMVPHTLDKNLIFTQKKNEYYSLVKFPMPAVREGSIIEYKYQVKTNGFAVPHDWKFQDDMPTVKSTYSLDMTSRTEVTYQVQRNPDFPIIEDRNLKDADVYFEMNNLPALRHEPFMDAERDYVQKVKFQLSGVRNFSGGRLKINTTWKELAYDLMSEKYFGSQLDKDLKIDEVKKIVQAENSETKKLKAIYYYVIKNYSWNGYYSIYASGTLKEVADNKTGNAADINLLLINLLKTNGIEVYPLLAAERSFGKVDTGFPFMDQFNKTIVFATADGRQYILDATQKNCPPGLTPYEYLNTMAFLVDKKKFEIVNISSPSNGYRNKIKIEAAIDKEGIVSGTANVESIFYARQERLTKFQNSQKNFVREQFEDPSKNLVVNNFLASNIAVDSLPFIQGIRYTQQLERSADLLFVNTNLFTGLEKNPFILSKRFTDINFGYPYYFLVEQTIKLLPGSKTEIPEDIALILPDPDIRLFRQIKAENDLVRVIIVFVQNTTVVPASSYNTIKNFYRQMVDKLNEPIMVKHTE